MHITFLHIAVIDRVVALLQTKSKIHVASQSNKARLELHVPWLCKGQLAKIPQVKQRL